MPDGLDDLVEDRLSRPMCRSMLADASTGRRRRPRLGSESGAVWRRWDSPSDSDVDMGTVGRGAIKGFVDMSWPTRLRVR